MSSVITNEDLAKRLDRHVEETKERFEKGDKNFDRINRVLFGDKEIGETGMKDKLDDIHKILTQASGVGAMLKWLGVIGVALAFIKFWILGIDK